MPPLNRSVMTQANKSAVKSGKKVKKMKSFTRIIRYYTYRFVRLYTGKHEYFGICNAKPLYLVKLVITKVYI